ncbi:MAG: EAL domain-containing protein [Gemmatimonadaceae bacterium]|nr:EAL domain-containing protein [Gemmatimonadaceae bacterium]
MHPSFAQPIHALLGDVPLPDAVRAVLEAASATLHDAERERAASERALEELSHELEHRLEQSRATEERYRLLFDLGPLPAFVLRRSDRVVMDWNAAAEQTFEWSKAQVVGAPIDALGICQMGCAIAMRLMGGTRFDAQFMAETTLLTARREEVVAEVQALEISLGGVDAVLMMMRDVTAQRRAERAARENAARFQAFFDHAGIAVQLLTIDGRIERANPACRSILGFAPDEMVGTSLQRFLHPDDVLDVPELFAELVSTARESVTLERRLCRRDGSVVWGLLTVASASTGDAPRLMLMLQDVTERKRMEEELTRQAFEDELTGLANRALFRDRLRHALERRARHHADVAVLLLDLDGFKRVNDSLGHAAGDALLRVVGQRIANTVRAGETVARLGGDEFAIVIESVRDDEDPQSLAERLLRIISAPITVHGREVAVNVSIGIAVAEPGDDGDAVLRSADIAMYSAKTSGKHCARVFDPSMHERAVVWLEVEQDLRRAIVNQEFELYFQPLVRLGSGRVRGFEALLRWRHPRRGLVLPGEFLTVAEETGLMITIGRWVLHDACKQAASWPDLGDGLPSVSVNLAPRQLESEMLVGDVQGALTRSGLDAARLILEITEGEIMRHPDTALARLRELKALGVRVAIDDFGTGYSSLSHLQYFPVDELKIDRSFVSRMEDGEREASFVRTMLSLAHSIGVEVVAEGIERNTQEQTLTELGCHTGQGYLFSHPVGGENVVAWLAQHASALAEVSRSSRPGY